MRALLMVTVAACSVACRSEPLPITGAGAIPGLSADLGAGQAARDLAVAPDLRLVATDLATPPLGPSKHSSNPGFGVRCAGEVCGVGQACEIGFADDGVAGDCVTVDADATGVLHCDGPEDCAAGEVCFGSISDPMGVIHASRCRVAPEVHWWLCHDDDDCSANLECWTDYGGGAGVGHCE